MHYEKNRGSGMKVGVVSSVGLPRKHGGWMFDRDGEVINLPGPAGDLLEMYDCREMEVIAHIYKEMQIYDVIMFSRLRGHALQPHLENCHQLPVDVGIL
ncbi:hypothetical protein EGR_09417 [Echinococcus granulosus]|uniref:Uncharacterized protein n=1 Tax=Echinococcus granulosus TaxID=6210 RepID=W6UQK1_ECHGR|nr:hypothetical protein EGR_09417 [Echinococcus granulosus]EUB55704.1 hypothetical protein EGR_09417 [Echinococcus granulosus]